MNPVIRNILAVVSGIIAGSLANMGIIMIAGAILPPPEGADLSTVEGARAAMSVMGPKHLMMPFLAHALGTFAGALVAAIIAASHKMKIALGIGVFYLLGGIAAAIMIPAPTWYVALDLILAYIPTAYIAGKLASSKN